MKPMDSTTEQMMARYLLGAASDSECVEVEDRFLRDAEYMAHLRTIEYDLMDDYLLGEMPDRDRLRFEAQLRLAPDRSERLARARRVLNGLDRLAVESAPAAAPFAAPRPEVEAPGVSQASRETPSNRAPWRRLVSRITPPWPALQYGLAAIAALALLGGIWSLHELRADRETLARLNAERDASRRDENELRRQLEVQQSEQRRLAAQLQKNLDEQRARGAQLQAEIGRLTSRPSFDDRVVALALTPGIDRGPANQPRKLAIPKGAREIRLQLELGPASNYRSYRAEIATPGGAQVWSQSGLQAANTEYGRFVTLTIPARALEASEYELTLHGMTGARQSEVAGYYYFIAAPAADSPR